MIIMDADMPESCQDCRAYGTSACDKWDKHRSFSDQRTKRHKDCPIVGEIEQESKTGHWIVDGSVDCYLDKVRCHCSECGKKKEFPADYDHIKHKLSISYQYPEFIDNYCPNCGARMFDPQESDRTCHTCKHYLSGERDGSCGSYICKEYSNWESENEE